MTFYILKTCEILWKLKFIITFLFQETLSSSRAKFKMDCCSICVMVMLRLVMNLITIALLLGSAFLIYYVSDMSVQVCSIDVLNSFLNVLPVFYQHESCLPRKKKVIFFIFIQFWPLKASMGIEIKSYGWCSRIYIAQLSQASQSLSSMHDFFQINWALVKHLFFSYHLLFIKRNLLSLDTRSTIKSKECYQQ